MKASYLYWFITKDEKNVISDVKMKGFDSTDSHELAFILPYYSDEFTVTQSMKCDV